MAKDKYIKYYKNKNILITGGTGLIGMPLAQMLIDQGAKILIVSLDKKPKLKGKFKFIKKDLRELKNCLQICKNQEIVFHLAGIKGSPQMTIKKPASFLVPTVTFTF